MPTRCIASAACCFQFLHVLVLPPVGLHIVVCASVKVFLNICVCVFCAGGELFTLLEREGVFLEDSAR
jgi:hypothetical protein